MKQVTVLICITPLHVRGNLCWPAVPVSTVLPLRAEPDSGIVRYLPELVALLAPSVLSAERLQPGHWSGAYACWGLENRKPQYVTVRQIGATLMAHILKLSV